MTTAFSNAVLCYLQNQQIEVTNFSHSRQRTAWLLALRLDGQSSAKTSTNSFFLYFLFCATDNYASVTLTFSSSSYLFNTLLVCVSFMPFVICESKMIMAMKYS